MILLVRIGIGVAVFVFAGVVVDQLANDGSVAAAIRQWIFWALRIVWQWILSVIGSIYRPLAVWLHGAVKRFALRRFMQPLWRALWYFIAFLLVRRWGHAKYAERREMADELKRRVLGKLLGIWNYKPNLPRWIRALIACASIGLCIWLFLVINERLGWWEGLVFSFIAAFVVEKLPLIGFDQFAAIVMERWRPIRAWIDWFSSRFPTLSWWISWLWLRPFFMWLGKKLGLNEKFEIDADGDGEKDGRIAPPVAHT